MSEFYGGQKVVCVSAFENIQGGETFPVKGCVYTVREAVYRPGCGEFAHGLLLVEIANRPRRYKDGHHEKAFALFRFKPLEEKPDAIEWVRQICRDVEAGNLIPEHAA